MKQRMRGYIYILIYVCVFTIVNCGEPVSTVKNQANSAQESDNSVSDSATQIQESFVYPVIVIGAGPGGLFAAFNVARALQENVPVLTAGKTGGNLAKVKFLANWPGVDQITGLEVINQLQKQAENVGVILVDDSATKIDFSQKPFVIETEGGLQLHAHCIIVATGARPKKLPGVKGFEENIGKGVAFCTICEAPFNKDKDVAVIGGDDFAAEYVRQLAVYAKKIYMVVPGKELTCMAATKAELEKDKKVEIMYNTTLKEIGGDGKEVTFMEIVTHGDAPKKILVKSVFVALGMEPNSQLFADVLKLDTDKSIILTGKMQQTSAANIFAIGMVTNPECKATMACGQGMAAAIQAVKTLHESGYQPPKNQIRSFKNITSTEADHVKIRSISTQEELQKIVAQNKEKTIVLYVYGVTCTYCKQMGPLVQQVADELKDVIFLKAEQEKARTFTDISGLIGVPSLVIFKDGELYDNPRRGLKTKEEIIKTVMEPQPETVSAE